MVCFFNLGLLCRSLPTCQFDLLVDNNILSLEILTWMHFTEKLFLPIFFLLYRPGIKKPASGLFFPPSLVLEQKGPAPWPNCHLLISPLYWNIRISCAWSKCFSRELEPKKVGQLEITLGNFWPRAIKGSWLWKGNHRIWLIAPIHCPLSASNYLFVCYFSFFLPDVCYFSLLNNLLIILYNYTSLADCW